MAKVKDAVSVNLNEANIQNITIIDISPETAKQMLEKNTKNRSVKSNTVDKYARDMKSGTWYDNGIPIIIDEDGVIKDGQHRLHAISKSGKTVRMLVIQVRKGEAKGYDCNAVRTMADRLKIGEYDDVIDKENKYLVGTVASSMANTALRLKKVIKPSPNEMADFISKHSDAVEYAAKHRKTDRGVCKIGIWVAIAAARESGYPESLLDSFCEVLTSGLTDDKRMFPAIKLRNWVKSNTVSGEQMMKSVYMRTQYALKMVESCNANATCKEATKEYYKFKW